MKKFSAASANLEKAGDDPWLEESGGTEGSEASEEVFGSKTLEAALQGVCIHPVPQLRPCSYVAWEICKYDLILVLKEVEFCNKCLEQLYREELGK